MKKYLCTDINESLLNKEVTVSGWVSTRRDHGGVIFVDLRDHSGIVQLVFNEFDSSFIIASCLTI